MGTQQLLLIVLGVIIVGIAIAVGITIFNNQAYNNNRQAVATELNTYGTSAIQWWKTPVAQGGAGKTFNATTAVADIAEYIGFTDANSTITTDTGTFTLQSAAASNNVVIKGVGTEKRDATLVTLWAVVDLVDGDIEVETENPDA